jgi:uncharacterized protein YbaP (TraB family)
MCLLGTKIKLYRHYLLLALLLIIATKSVKAQLLWEISGKNLTKPSYLFGTMHVTDERVFNFSTTFMNKFDSSEVIAGELKMSWLGAFKGLPSVFMKKDTTLGDLLPPEKYKIVHQEIERQQLGNYVEKMKPIFVSALIEENKHEKEKKQDKNEKPALDFYLQKLAKKQNKEIVGLETFEEQISALESIPLKLQAEWLYESIAHKDSLNPEDTEQMLRLYLAENIDSLYTITTTSLNDSLIFAQMLTLRNRRMCARAEKIMEKKSVFIAVGAAHLPGKQGMIDIFRKRGYTVTPVAK